MNALRWKPLKSSVKSARFITRTLQAISVIVLFVFLTEGIVGALLQMTLIGAAIGLAIVLIGVVFYWAMKAGYVALELLTEIADDTRLQLLSIAGDCDDGIQRQEANQLDPDDGGGVTYKSEITEDIRVPDATVRTLEPKSIAASGKTYDQAPPEIQEAYYKALEGYRRDGGKKNPSFSQSMVSKLNVIFRDSKGDIISQYCLFEGQWIRN